MQSSRLFNGFQVFEDTTTSTSFGFPSRAENTQGAGAVQDVGVLGWVRRLDDKDVVVAQGTGDPFLGTLMLWGLAGS